MVGGQGDALVEFRFGKQYKIRQGVFVEVKWNCIGRSGGHAAGKGGVGGGDNFAGLPGEVGRTGGLGLNGDDLDLRPDLFEYGRWLLLPRCQRRWG